MVEGDLTKAKKELVTKTAETLDLAKKRDGLEVKIKELTSDLESAKNEIKACKVEHDNKM